MNSHDIKEYHRTSDELLAAIRRVNAAAPMDEATHKFDAPEYEAALMDATEAAEACLEANRRIYNRPPPDDYPCMLEMDDTGKWLVPIAPHNVLSWLDGQQKALGEFYDKVREIRAEAWPTKLAPAELITPIEENQP